MWRCRKSDVFVGLLKIERYCPCACNRSVRTLTLTVVSVHCVRPFSLQIIFREEGGKRCAVLLYNLQRNERKRVHFKTNSAQVMSR